jgi:carotenoid 1,2-hydratase
LSDDGTTLLVLIAMLGNVFSPAYLAARTRASRGARLPDPLDYCTINIALYTKNKNHWVLTESLASDVTRSDHRLQIGNSQVLRDGQTLTFQLNEREAPFGQPLIGSVRVQLPALVGKRRALTASGRHTWQPVAPLARAEVRLEAPACTFSGHAYVDTNAGTEPLEAGFQAWSWSRALLASGKSLLSYHCVDRDAVTSLLHIELAPDGTARDSTSGTLSEQALGTTKFGLPRFAYTDARALVTGIQTLESSPFYARSRFRTTLMGEAATVVHEQLSLTRFVAPWVQFLLPFRMRNGRPWLRDRAAAKRLLGPGRS